MAEITLSLNEIRAHNPCREGWGKALKSLGKTLADDTRVTFAWIIENNGLDDALWALRCLPEPEQWRSQLFARWCALSVIHLWDAPQMVKDYLTSGDERLRAAAEAAAGAAWDAAEAAAGAAWAAAEAAAGAARAAARAAAEAAARAAARDEQTAKLLEILSLDHEVTTLEMPEVKKTEGVIHEAHS